MEYINKYGQTIKVKKNPKSWLTNYSVWGYEPKRKWQGAYLISHHRARELAEKAARRLMNKDFLKVLGWK